MKRGSFIGALAASALPIKVDGAPAPAPQQAARVPTKVTLLGYPGTPYFGAALLQHEFSHGILRGSIYTHHDSRSREILKETDPKLYELVSQVMPTHRPTGTIFYARARLPW
jgi:hypothetical protein